MAQLTDAQIDAIAQDLRTKRDLRKTADDALDQAMEVVTEAQTQLATAQTLATAKEALFNEADEEYDHAVDDAIELLSGSKLND